jgi:hypothetical protein
MRKKKISFPNYGEFRISEVSLYFKLQLNVSKSIFSLCCINYVCRKDANCVFHGISVVLFETCCTTSKF